eukprot:TRINITY_DN5789_c2_g1_i1.p1 TRINITY_DN5789_c2_g1~~TRINITY_DN5789_c2_g1_i1.p1  ORF type:complete len:189 (-),score=24.63 TRINITY_DN5789_c2_g1_i1:179-745(-)
MSIEDSLKILVGGASKAGKTLLCKLLSEQDLLPGEYMPTKAVRVQELRCQVGAQNILVQLLDCGGDEQLLKYMPALIKDIDGLILVYDLKDKRESILEKWYIKCAQPKSLPMKTCLLVGIGSNSSNTPNNGMEGKLSKLTNITLDIDLNRELQPQVTRIQKPVVELFQGCLQHKQDLMEKLVMDSVNA